MRVPTALPQRAACGFSLTSLALALSLALSSPGHAATTTAVLNKVLQGAGINQDEATTIRDSISSGEAQSRLPAGHHEFFADQLRRYGLNEEARLFLEGTEPDNPSPPEATGPHEHGDTTAVTTEAEQASRELASSQPGSAVSGGVPSSVSVTSSGNGRPLPTLSESEVTDVRPGVAPDARELALLVNQIMRGEALSADERDALHRGLADDTLNRMIPAERHDDFISQLNRYGMDEEASMFEAGLSTQRDLLARLPGTPRPMYDRDFMDEYVQGVQYFTNDLGQRIDRRRGSQLIVVDYNDRIMRIDDPIAGTTLERVASSCLLNSGRAPGAGAPPQTYGTDMLVFDSPVNGRIRIEERTDGGYITTFLNYSVQRYAVSWSEQAGVSLPAYFFGGQIRPQYDVEGRRIGTITEPPKWHRFVCNVASVNF